MRPKQQGGNEMQYVLTGFTHAGGSRVFTFEGIGPDRTRTNFSVSADLALIRRYGIRSQELPLLCIRFLDQLGADIQEHNLTFAEEDMRRYMDNCAAERDAAQKKRTPRRPPNTAPRTEWAFPQPRQ